VSARQLQPSPVKLTNLEPGSLLYDDAVAIAEALIEIEDTQPHWSESAQGLLVALIMLPLDDKEF
jgi:hypothetical protein